MDEFFTGGDWANTYISASGRSGATNFHVSFNNLTDRGVMIGHDGLTRNTFRVNLDQSVQEDLTVSATAFYSLSAADPRDGQLFDLTRMPAGVNLRACVDDPDTEADETELSCANNPEDLILLVDPQNPESGNPIYPMIVRDISDDRDRFLGSLNTNWAPLDWFMVDGNVSYDQLNRTRQDYFPKGYRTIDPGNLNEGWLDRDEYQATAFNASLTGTGTWDIAENITNRTQLRYLYEQQDEAGMYTRGYEFAVADLVTFDNLDQENFTASSYNQLVRSDGYYAITNFDIYDRYIVDALVRNDGSSLFGADQRRQWYYRLAGAWRIAEESWFTLPAFDELKVNYAYGTAGSRPRFSAQYETYSVSGGRITPQNLGNQNLKPEFSGEHEVGLDASLWNGRIGLGVTYATVETTDQILPVPLPAFTGYSTQWQNAGNLASDTWEATLNARVFQTDDFLWSARLLYDRTRSTITSLDVPAFLYGVGGQGLGDVFYAREGEELGTFYGIKVAQSCADLPSEVSCDQFTVNNDGYLVYTGDGSLSDPQWGDAAPFDVGAETPMWGTPFAVQCTDRLSGELTYTCPVGNTMPDYHTSLSSSMSWKGLSLYGMIDAERGFSVYNQPLQWAVFKRTAGVCDQAGVPEVNQKPIGYCDALYGVSGLNPSTIFVEDASYVKLREVALRYTLDNDMLENLPGVSALSGLSLSLTGRNLYTWSDYRGYDPEVGSGGGDTGSAALARVDGYGYPNFRTWMLGVEVNF